MLRIEGFRRQQQASAVLMLRLCNFVELYRKGDDALRIAMQLARLLGQMRLQFAIEDRSLYSLLIASGDSATATLGRHFRDQMGGLALELEAFMTRWSSSALIASDFQAFERELMALLEALHAHAERSSATLYPLVEAMIDPKLATAA